MFVGLRFMLSFSSQRNASNKQLSTAAVYAIRENVSESAGAVYLCVFIYVSASVARFMQLAPVLCLSAT